MPIRRIAAFKIINSPIAVIIEVDDKVMEFTHEALDGFTEKRLINAVNAWANANQVSLPPFGIHRNRDDSLCVWTGEAPPVWPEDDNIDE